MKVFAVLGSPRDGNTNRVVRAIEEEMHKLGDAEFEYLRLKDADLKQCIGCFACLHKGDEYCPLRDIRPEIERKMMEADGVIFAAPTYVFNMPGLMKNFVDRFAYVCHRPRFYKPALVVTTTGAIGHQLSSFLMAMTVGFWGFDVVDKVSVAFLDNVNPGSQLTTDGLEKNRGRLGKAAAKFHKAIEAGPRQPTLCDLVTFYVPQHAVAEKAPKDLADYKYWKERGWLENDAEYAYKTKVNPLKKAIAKVITWATARGWQ